METTIPRNLQNNKRIFCNFLEYLSPFVMFLNRNRLGKGSVNKRHYLQNIFVQIFMLNIEIWDNIPKNDRYLKNQ